MWSTHSIAVSGVSPSPHLFTGTEEAVTTDTEDDLHRPRTISSSTEHEVSNGFVKNGSSLPYVYETSENGNRKRSSKLIPVCGICGKKFVCVTTMKRHLVTHTGEKPFSCKVCGKQYTQKGNLRVHERTHRNDRPFECNICLQKFYRKEPMQKHQWRQHAIVHLKTRPANTSPSAPLGIIGAEGVLYNSLIERIKGSGNGGLGQNDGQYEETQPVTDVSEHTPLPLSEVPEPSNHTEIENFSDEESLSSHSVTDAVTKYLSRSHDIEEQGETTVTENPSESMAQLQLMKTSLLVRPKVEETEEEPVDESVQKPMKLKMKLAQAYMKEVKEEREREERDHRERGGRGEIYYDHHDEDSSSAIEHNLSEIQLSTQLPPSDLFTTMDKQEEPLIKDEAGLEVTSVRSTCKSCGSSCLVSDPYNFRCPSCQVRYTSMPTHLIADPLQCIGCHEIFAHKPAMKSHQSSAHKERPFRCCRCGYEFRQKAHLQKHQWRIHRRKIEPDPNVKEAEAILQAVSDLPPTIPPETSTTLTIQQIIETSVERGLRDEVEIKSVGTKPLDLSPTKTCSYTPDISKMYGSHNSINAWVQQVETARSPIRPDISILKKPKETTISDTQSSVGENSSSSSSSFLTVLNPITPRPEDASLTIKLLEPTNGIQWPTEPLPQQFAVKSKPLLSECPSPLPPWRRLDREDNPLLNKRPDILSQVSVEVQPPTPTPSRTDNPVSFKRPRTDPEYISGDGRATVASRFCFPTDLTKSPYSPLDLSNDHKLQRFEEDQSPCDYSIAKSQLIYEQLNRLKSQDIRGGI